MAKKNGFTMLVSTRLSLLTIKLLTSFLQKHKYYNRSQVINNILRSVLANADDLTMLRLMEWYPRSGIKIKISVDSCAE